MANWLSRAIENAGTNLNLRERGISEYLNKMRATPLTGVNQQSQDYWRNRLPAFSDYSSGRYKSTPAGTGYELPTGTMINTGVLGANTYREEPAQEQQLTYEDGIRKTLAALSGAGGGKTYVPKMVETYPGSNQYFDLNDPTQREQYFAARQQYALGKAGEYETDQRSNLNLLIQQAKNEADTYRGQYQTAQDQENILWDQYLKDFAYGMQDLDTQYGQGESARMGKYTSLSPNAYQSSMGTSGQYALQKLGEGKTRKEEQKATEEKRKLSREAQRQADIKALNDYYNLYEQQQRKSFEDAVKSFREQLMGQASQEASDFATADAQKGVFNPAKYNYNQLEDWKPTQADTSDLIPDISFGTGGGAKTSGTNMLTQAAQSMATPKVASIPALDAYQGLKATSKEKDPLQTWLY